MCWRTASRTTKWRSRITTAPPDALCFATTTVALMLVLVMMITTIRNTSRPDLSWTRHPSIREQCRVEWWAATAQIDRHRWRQAFKKIQVRPTAEDRAEDIFLMEGFSRLSLRKKNSVGESDVWLLSTQGLASSKWFLYRDGRPPVCTWILFFFFNFSGWKYCIFFRKKSSNIFKSGFFLLSLCPSLSMSPLSLI